MTRRKRAFLYGFLFLVLNDIDPVFATGGSADIVLPLKLSTQGFPTTSIQIQNHNIPLIFDSGASKTAITLSRDIVNKLHLQMKPANKKVCFHDDTGKETCLREYTLAELKLGQLTMYNVSCQLMDSLWGGHYDEGFVWFDAAKNGVIGLDLLRQFNVLVDYKKSRIILSKLGEYPSQYNMKTWVQVPFSSLSGIVHAKINGIDTRLVWDTGANNSIIKSTAKIAAVAKKKSCASKSNPNCQCFEAMKVIAGNKQLPKIKFFVQDNEFPFDGLVGSNFFKDHTVFFDFKRNIILIGP
jgi:hypothetical protein